MVSNRIYEVLATMKKILIPIIIVLCLAGGGYALWHTLQANVFSTDQLPSNSIINGVDCSDLSPEQAAEKLAEEWNSLTFSFTKDNSTLGTIDNLNFTYDIETSLKTIKEDHFVSAALKYLFKRDFKADLSMKVEKVNKGFRKSLRQADYLQEKPVTKTKDASIDLSTNEFKIIPEVYGNNIDYDKLTEKISSLIAQGQFSMEYTASDFYKQPEITSDSEEIKELQNVYKEYLDSKVTYQFGSQEVKIPAEDLEKMYNFEFIDSVSTDADGSEKKSEKELKVTVNEDAVREYVEGLAREYNTLGMTRTFTSLSGNKISVSGGDYGYAISMDNETEQLIKDLESGKEVKREPKWLMTGFTEYSQTDDIGDTYVEISISKQHLWYFKDGKKIVDCDVVTGNQNQYDTPKGTYGLTYKERDAVLKGSNADGSSYESPVSYWMPFYGNYGMHDAPWRSSFGGTIYQGGGSHGCVNMPVASAKKLFNNLANQGVPIIVY